jgi:hypothetical protein
MQERQVSGADELDGAVSRCAAHHEGGELPGQGALRENTIGGFHHAIQRQIGVREAAEGCVKVAH